MDVAAASGFNEPKPVPNATFKNLNGDDIILSRFKGKILLINFWGTWCVPCLQEIPDLVELSHRFKSEGLEVVGIAIDSGRPEDIRKFMSEHGMDYLVLIGELGVVKSRFHVIGFPTSLLIDRDGMIRKRYVGPQTEKVLKVDVKSLL
jgi:peroxiredoxin